MLSAKGPLPDSAVGETGAFCSPFRGLLIVPSPLVLRSFATCAI